MTGLELIKALEREKVDAERFLSHTRFAHAEGFNAGIDRAIELAKQGDVEAGLNDLRTVSVVDRESPRRCCLASGFPPFHHALGCPKAFDLGGES